jgi:hypothetical protein
MFSGRNEINSNNKEHKTILNKLYTDTYINKDKFREEKNNIISLNEDGRKYYSTIIQDAYQYYENTKFL